jgi:hypothetical protein
MELCIADVYALIERMELIAVDAFALKNINGTGCIRSLCIEKMN